MTAQEAAGLFSEAEQRLADLERERINAEAAADAAESRLREEPVDPDLHGWAAEQLRRFTRELRAEHEAQMQERISTAEQRARDCIARARLEADVIISYGRAMHAVRAVGRIPETTAATGEDEPARPEPAAPSPVDVLTASEATMPTPIVVPERPPETPSPPEAATPPPGPADPADPPSIDAAAVPAAPPIPPAPAISAEPPTPAEPPTGETAAVPPTPSVPTPAEPEAAATNGSEAPEQAPPPADGQNDFWPEQPERGLRRLLHRLPRLAILQVLAVIVILVVVLLRIG